MVRMQCPIGVLITPEHIWIYRDSYMDRSPDSVRRVGKYSIASLWREPPPAQGPQFETFVQRWLEDLAKTPERKLPDDLGEALREYVLPAIASGNMHAAHPRYS